jgi:hypothetical protein
MLLLSKRISERSYTIMELKNAITETVWSVTVKTLLDVVQNFTVHLHMALIEEAPHSENVYM